MKRGDIYKNLWAGYDCYFIYQGHIRKDMVRGYCVHNAYGNSDWRWKSAQYSAKSFTEDEGKHFPLVGHIDLEKIICNAILEEVNKHGKSQET